MQGFSVQVGCPHGSLPYREVADGVFSRVENVESGGGVEYLTQRTRRTQRGEPIEGLTV